MSYNAYQASNQSYSPYYQQSAGQDGRAQYNGQPRGDNAYQNNSYQPLSAYQSRQAPPSSTAQPTNAATAYNDSGYGSGVVGGRQDSRAGYTDGRSSVDTTALGNLAYASSLGRDSPSFQQAMSYNRAQNPAGYSTLPSYGAITGGSIHSGNFHQRRDSNGPVNTPREENPRAHSAITSPSLGFSANGGNSGYQSQQTMNNTSQAQLQYTGTQFPQSTGEAYLSQYSNSSRPSSGQAVRRPPSTTDSQGISPTAPPDQIVRNHSDGHFRRVSTNARPDKPRAPTPQQQSSQKRPPSSNGPRMGTYTSDGQTQPVASGTAPKPPAQSSTTSAQTPSRNTYNPSQPSNSGNQTNGHKSQESASRTIQNPTTVNPSQVFNDAEYQRRQAAAAAEVEAARKRAEDERVAAIPKDVSSSIPRIASSDADAAKKDQMELEMKQMIEKMRDYKSKDPSLFSQIWEQVKKGQPAQRGSPQVAPQGSSPSPVVINDQPPSPAVHLPPESELPAANGESFPPHFDRGRFPAQRRRRGGANYTPEKKQATPKGSARSVSTGINADPGNQTMQKAMTEFHKSTSSPIPSGQTPSKEQQPRPPSRTEPTAIPAPSSTAASTPTHAATPQAGTQPPPSKAGGTYWPENKKRQLAEAARAALTSSKQNVGKHITTDEIHNLLDQNPSYTQMCEILEYRGFVIDRGQFARLLLSAVPDLGASTQPMQPPTHHGLPSPSPAPPDIGLSATSRAQAPPSQTTLQAGQGRQMPYPVSQPYHTNGYSSPYGHRSQPGQHPVPQAQMTPASISSKDSGFTDPSNPHQLSQHPAQQQGNHGYPGRGILYPHPSLPPPPPLQSSTSSNPSKNKVRWSDKQNHSTGVSQPPSTRKQDMARKRSFGEIVDLTQGLSDEDDEPLSQRPRVNDTSEIRVYTAGRGPDSGTATPGSIKDATALEEYRYKPTGKEEYLRANDIILPMNKRQDALRRSSYNPKTIARDILLAIGKHPTMAPLNSHLDVLRERFAAVNYESDLSTFRWDLVDPGGPPPVIDTSVDEDTHQSRRTSGMDHRSRLAVVVKGSGPFNVEPGQGRRRNEGFKPTRGGHTVSGSRPKPSGSKISSNPQTPQNTTVTSQGITRTSLSDSGFARFVHNDLPVMLNNITGSNDRTPATQSSVATTPASSAAKARVLGRVGRPPGAKNKNPRPDKGISKKSRDTPTQDASSSARIPANAKDSPIQIRDTPPVQTQAAPIRTPSSSLKDRPRISTTPVRPSSLRNAVTPIDGIAVIIPSRSPSVMGNSPVVSVPPSARKTSPYSTSKPDFKQSPAPTTSYKVYKCHWDKCPAELHNLETLRKHVRKHRAEDDFERGPHPCLWSRCITYDGTSPTFGSVEEWDRHVVSQHVEAVGILSSGDGSSAEASDARTSPVASKAKVIRRGGPGSAVPSAVRPMVVLPS